MWMYDMLEWLVCMCTSTTRLPTCSSNACLVLLLYVKISCNILGTPECCIGRPKETEVSPTTTSIISI